MTTTAARVLALGTLLFASSAPAYAATPAPTATKAAHHLPSPHLPSHNLHTEFVVEVNKLGQVVRVKSGKSCDWPSFNAQTYGNVLQMWIRHPDGSAQVGLYKVTYDYSAGTKKVRRNVALLQTGGNWGEEQGAALQMMDIANKEARGEKLPSLDQIVGSPSPSPHP